MLLWWKRWADSYPLLARVARVIFGAPASSAVPERDFSAAGRMMTSSRSIMDSKYVGMNLFLHGNLDGIPQDIPKRTEAVARKQDPWATGGSCGRAGGARMRFCAGGPHRRAVGIGGGGRLGKAWDSSSSFMAIRPAARTSSNMLVVYAVRVDTISRVMRNEWDGGGLVASACVGVCLFPFQVASAIVDGRRKSGGGWHG